MTEGTESAEIPLATTEPPALASGAAHAPSGLARLRLRQWFALTAAALAVMLALAVAVMGISVYRANAATHQLVEVIDPAAVQAHRLGNAVIEQEASLRGYAFTADHRFLTRYGHAQAEQGDASLRLQALLAQAKDRGAQRALVEMDRSMQAWRESYAEPLIDTASEHGARQRLDALRVQRGQGKFSEIQRQVEAQQRSLDRTRVRAVHRLNRQLIYLYGALAAAVAILIVAMVWLVRALRRVIVQPVAQLATQSSKVAGGDFAHPLSVSGPAELMELAGNVDSMRNRIIEEWTAASDGRWRVDRQADELRRSNAELEQFAYVASHDLQEPLRKVASFCQLLERRYSDQLDERGRQYIAYATDGARRMQTLINDLLSFSRVGRAGLGDEVASMTEALHAALSNLAQAVEDTGAEVTTDALPDVRGDQTLLTQLLQNLIGNSMKFRGQRPPRVHIGVRSADGEWEFSCTDNGIGVDPRHAQRIFLIFQRLHGADDYSGTGIGLALCKKIVEYHGGTIWLDEDIEEGATFRWTLPRAPRDNFTECPGGEIDHEPG